MINRDDAAVNNLHYSPDGFFLLWSRPCRGYHLVDESDQLLCGVELATVHMDNPIPSFMSVAGHPDRYTACSVCFDPETRERALTSFEHMED